MGTRSSCSAAEKVRCASTLHQAREGNRWPVGGCWQWHTLPITAPRPPSLQILHPSLIETGIIISSSSTVALTVGLRPYLSGNESERVNPIHEMAEPLNSIPKWSRSSNFTLLKTPKNSLSMKRSSVWTTGRPQEFLKSRTVNAIAESRIFQPSNNTWTIDWEQYTVI